jgi:hypothetical protein
MVDATELPKVYKGNNGDTLTVASGGVLNVEAGGALQLGGVDKTALLAAAVANPVASIAAGLKIVGGQHVTVAAADTVATGLANVVGVIVSLDSDPGDDPEWVSATVGDQAGAPVAGSIIIKTWKNTAGNDPTPLAATTFAKKVNWLAFGS